MHYQLELNLVPLMEKLDVDERSLAGELGVNLAHVKRLKDDDWKQISRTDLQALMCWGKKHNHDVLEVVPSPLWRTFHDSDVVIVRGRDDNGNPLPSDSEVEAKLITALTEANCQVKQRYGDELDLATVTNMMATENVIFVGSPKYNAATEYALSALWKLKAGDATGPNHAKAPFRFLWDTAPRKASAFCAKKKASESPGILMMTSGGRRGHQLLPADWRDPEVYRRWNGKGRDAGVLVVCHRPLGTDKDVTTLILAGYSGFATQDMAADVVHDGLRIESRDVAAGAPVIRLLAARYKKVGRRESRTRVTKGRRWIGPPWNQIERIRG